MGALYNAYLTNRKNALHEDNVSIVIFEHSGENYRVIMTRKRANKRTIIYFIDKTIEHIFLRKKSCSFCQERATHYFLRCLLFYRNIFHKRFDSFVGS